MKKIFLIVLIGIIFLSCGSRKRTITRKKAENIKERVVEIKDSNSVKAKPIKTTNTSRIINSTTDYIDVFKDIAIHEMRTYNIPASITLAQGILESGSGKGRLAVKANNHFGIKCHGWTGAKIYHDDDARQECFRKYDNAKYSFRDHSEFLKRKRYANLFKLEIDDYKGWARELRRAGYATDKRYPQKLIALVERYNLTQYDEIVIGKKRKNKKEKVAEEIVKHIVVKGDTLYSISKRYNLTVKELQRINSIKGTEISIGQILNLK
ncbi:LysM peptidoglycan-binding domain-containing protein [Flavobacteriaceae bacterium AU392]|nr:LysM peptidoglycan-binding domain-containing protein [Flavobacteriaceae bacterium]RKM86972.1 LysM peptidoglycan-binding domain-containing protein [Flavobacteriaceae bacterium AU392]